MKEKIVVMGGSFNPPTIAHIRLMQVAMNHVGAEKGIFVPVSQAYLKRKLRKLKDRQVAFSVQLRMDMLNAICNSVSGICISELELYKSRGRTYDTLSILQEESPNAEFYFLVGADKINLVEHWMTSSDFLDKFKIIVFNREGIDLKERLEQSLDSIVIVEQPEEINNVSSTRIREHFIQGTLEQVKDDLCPDVYKLLKEYTIEDFPLEIEGFKGKYEFLSNDFPAPFEWNGYKWQCVESAFQASRCYDSQQALTFLNCDGNKAKQRAHKIRQREDWERVKDSMMLELLTEKFRQHPELAKDLIDTDNAILVASDKDTYWGKNLYTYIGENQLGKALMLVRESLKREQEKVDGKF